MTKIVCFTIKLQLRLVT